MSEIFKAVKNYEGIYEVSNLGRVKSLKRKFVLKERILKSSDNGNGYLGVDLSKKAINKKRLIHQLVAESFLNHTPNGNKLVVNHIDFNKINNNINNLEIVTNRENSNLKHHKSSSKYTGVSWHKHAKKWSSNIWINGKLKHLGYFTNELEASQYYENALDSFNNGTSIKVKKHKWSSQYKGVHWDKERNKWQSQIQIKGKQKHLGRFTDELQASQAYQTALNRHNATSYPNNKRTL